MRIIALALVLASFAACDGEAGLPSVDVFDAIHLSPGPRNGEIGGDIGGRGAFYGSADVYIQPHNSATNVKVHQTRDGAGFGMILLRSDRKRIDQFGVGEHMVQVPAGIDLEETLTLCSGESDASVTFDEYVPGNLLITEIPYGLRFEITATSSLGEDVYGQFDLYR